MILQSLSPGGGGTPMVNEHRRGKDLRGIGSSGFSPGS